MEDQETKTEQALSVRGHTYFIIVSGAASWSDYRHIATPLFLANKFAPQAPNKPNDFTVEILIPKKIELFTQNQLNSNHKGKLPYSVANHTDVFFLNDAGLTRRFESVSDLLAIINGNPNTHFSDYLDYVKNLEQNDTLVLYLCGHGTRTGLFKANAKTVKVLCPDDLAKVLLPKAKQTILLNSMCYSGLFCSEVKRTAPDVLCCSGATDTTKAYSVEHINAINGYCGLRFTHAWAAFQLKILAEDNPNETVLDWFNFIIKYTKPNQTGQVWPACSLEQENVKKIAKEHVDTRPDPALPEQLLAALKAKKELLADDTNSYYHEWVYSWLQVKEPTFGLTILGDLLLRKDMQSVWEFLVKQIDPNLTTMYKQVDLNDAELESFYEFTRLTDPQLYMIEGQLYDDYFELLRNLVKQNIGLKNFLKAQQQAIEYMKKKIHKRQEKYSSLSLEEDDYNTEWKMLFSKPEDKIFLPRLYRADFFFRQLIEKCWKNIIGEENWIEFNESHETASLDHSKTKWVDPHLYTILDYSYSIYFDKILCWNKVPEETLKKRHDAAIKLILLPKIKQLCNLNHTLVESSTDLFASMFEDLEEKESETKTDPVQKDRVEGRQTSVNQTTQIIPVETSESIFATRFKNNKILFDSTKKIFQDPQRTLDKISNISGSVAIIFWKGVAQALLGNHVEAVNCYKMVLQNSNYTDSGNLQVLHMLQAWSFKHLKMDTFTNMRYNQFSDASKLIWNSPHFNLETFLTCKWEEHYSRIADNRLHVDHSHLPYDILMQHIIDTTKKQSMDPSPVITLRKKLFHQDDTPFMKNFIQEHGVAVATRLANPFLYGILVIISDADFFKDSDWVTSFQNSDNTPIEASDLEKQLLLGDLRDIPITIFNTNDGHLVYRVELLLADKEKILATMKNFLHSTLLDWKEVVFGGHGIEETGNWSIGKEEITYEDVESILLPEKHQLFRPICKFYINCCYSYIWKSNFKLADNPFTTSSTPQEPSKLLIDATAESNLIFRVRNRQEESKEYLTGTIHYQGKRIEADSVIHLPRENELKVSYEKGDLIDKESEVKVSTFDKIFYAQVRGRPNEVVTAVLGDKKTKFFNARITNVEDNKRSVEKKN